MSNYGFLPPKPSLTHHRPQVDAPAALRIAGTYLIVGFLWIFLSDRALSLLFHHPVDTMTWLQTLKGWFYVIATTGMLYWLVSRETKFNRQTTRRLKNALVDLIETQAALRTSEERYRRIVETQTDFVMRSTADTTITFANTTLCNALARSPEQVLGMQWSRFVPAEDLDLLQQKIAALSPEQPTFENINPDYRVDGQVGWTQWINLGIFDEQGELLEIQSVGRDITQLRQAEDALRQSEERFRAFMDNSPASSWITDPEGRVVYISQTYLRAFRVPQTPLGKRVLDLYPQDIAQVYLENAQRVINTGQALEAIEPGILADGSLGQFLVYKFPLPQPDGTVHVGGVAIDITEQQAALRERERAEAALQTSEQRYRAIIEEQTELVLRWLPDRRVLFVNDAYCRFFNQIREEFLGQDFLIVVPESIRDWLRTELEERINTLTPENPTAFNEHWTVDANGQPHYYHWTDHGIFNSEGRLIEIQSVGHDITDRKRAEETLHQREQEFRALAENAPDIIARFDRNLRHLYVNPAVTVATGLSPQSFIGKTNQELGMPEAQVLLWDATFSRVFTTGEQQHIEFRFSTPDGVKDYQARCVPEFATDGSVASALVVARDITAQKQLEQALRQRVDQEQALNRVLQAIRQSLDLDTIFTAATAEIAQLVQADRAAIVQYLPERQCWIHVSEYRRTSDIPNTLGIEIPDQGNPLAEQLKQLKAVRVDHPDALEDAVNHDYAQQFPGSWLLVPLVVNQTLWGSFSMVRLRQPSPWNEEEADLVQTIAVQLAIAIQQAQIFEQAHTELLERQQAEKHLRTALAEKEVLLKEIHHRVKNNLQIVSGLLQLQAQGLDDPQTVNALRESQNRVESMSLIHKKLYTSSDLGQIDVSDYIHNLAISLLTTYQISPGAVALQVEVEPVLLSLDQAIPCGLIINELVSNALKYAFPDRRPGAIGVKLCQINNQLELTVQDNGVGLPTCVDWQNASSLGLSLVYALATEQLEGNLAVDRTSGTTFTIQFPQSVPKQ